MNSSPYPVPFPGRTPFSPWLGVFWAFLAVLWFAFSSQSFGKAAYYGEAEMIRAADVIAIVDITRLEEVLTKGETFDYRQLAHATVHRTLKGTLPQEVQLHGNETFICAQTRFEPGRFLVFLRREKNLLVGCNWHLSVRPIKGDRVEWYSGEGIALWWQPLAAVLARVEKTISKAAAASEVKS